MKKTLLLFLCVIPFALMAQEKIIKIAILETIDKSNTVEYNQRMLVRSTLAKTITGTQGYEAYDRVDLKTIFGEQDFQRTGNVSSDQIKEIGRMTGAQYIMVSEIVKMDAKTYYITAKILDVETAQALSMSDAISTMDITSMREACTKMATELLEMPNKKRAQQMAAQAAKASGKGVSNAKGTTIQQRDTLISIMLDREGTLVLQKYIGNQNKAIGKAMKTTGTVSLAIGVPCLAAGIASLMYANMVPNPVKKYTTNQAANLSAGLEYISVAEYNDKVQHFSRSTHAAEVAGYILTPMGGALTLVGIPLYIKGQEIMTMKVTYTGNGAGLAFSF